MAFWQRIVASNPGRVLELGCGTGRLSLPLARNGVELTGVDRSRTMLARAVARRRRAKLATRLQLVRADIRALPFESRGFQVVIAPYGIIQSVLTDRDVLAVFVSVARVLAPGGLLGIDVVADLPRWPEYRERVQLRGRQGPHVHLTLIESVVQDPRRRMTRFAQRFVSRRGRRATEHRFEIKFRTPSLRRLTTLLEQAGFRRDMLLGDYSGREWQRGDEAMIILARRV